MSKIIYPQNLPVSHEIDNIKKLVVNNQVIIVCGETGSGKTTQLPKMLYDMGYAQEGRIGHTQPRKVAAKSIARRIGEELGNEHIVGYKVRFHDKTSPDTKIKLMTDGILLQEIQTDKFLKQYKALVIDEAHERSLNIDFILGHVKNIIDKRPDLKVIITSATIENEKFSKFFNDAPIINVEGKTFPVDIVYQPFEEDDEINLNSTIHKAIESCFEIELGNVLVFLPGEREIKDCISFLKKTRLNRYQLLALFSRQNEYEQNLVFHDDGLLKVIVTTNVAETSITIPGIKYVIDSGLARIKRYNSRTRVEQLQIERISQSSAKQRAGRAGRLSHGMCVRLYSEQDFNLRDQYTTAEILRSNLANVILRLISFKLGSPLTFPFLDKPENKAFNDGFKTLYQLNAINKDNNITELGRKISLIPIDVNLSRMLYSAAFEYNVIDEVLIIVTLLAVVDPREYPLELQTKVREAQALWEDKDSDFITILNLWNWYKHELLHKKSQRKLRENLHDKFLNANRMREWHELHGQLKELMKNLGAKFQEQHPFENSKNVLKPASVYNYQYIHQALLTGLLSNIGQKDLVENYYIGTQGKKFFIHPISVINKAKWICSASLTQTTKLYARMNAKILPEWLVPLTKHLVKYVYSDERFDKKRGEVVASEASLLYGLLLCRKNVPLYKINMPLAHEIFIRQGIILDQLGRKYNFIAHNQKVLEEIDKLESKYRTTFIIIEDELYKFYSNIIPNDISDFRSFGKWCQNNEEQLKLNITQFVEQFAKDIRKIELYPDFIQSGIKRIKLKYVFDPSRSDDGINAYINLEDVNLVNEDVFSWLVLGLVRDKVTFIVKALSKQIRISLNPINNFITNFLEQANLDSNFNQELANYINQLLKSTLKPHDIEKILLPAYLKVHYVILENTKIIYRSDSLLQVKNELSDKLHKIVSQVSSEHEVLNIESWVSELDYLLKSRKLLAEGREVIGYNSLVVKDGTKGVSLNYAVIDSLDKAIISTKRGILYLIKLNLPVQLKFIRSKQFNHFKETLMLLIDVYLHKDIFLEDVIDFIIKYIISIWAKEANVQYSIPANEREFNNLLSFVKGEIGSILAQFADLIYHIGLNYNKVKKKIKGHKLEESILLQLDDLIFPSFLKFVAFDNLKHFPRYLEAILYRLDKFSSNPNKDQMFEDDINEIYTAWYNYVDEQESKHKPVSQEIYNFKYKIEELRVSLFAQELKTAYTISNKRLWKEIEEFSKRI